jgi:hypothetical protein
MKGVPLWLSWPEMMIFIYTALETHKGPPYIFCDYALETHKGPPYIIF